MTPTSLDAIRDWLTNEIAALLGMPPEDIDPNAPLERFGIASRDAITLVGDLENWTGLSLSPTLVYEYPTIEAISRHIASRLRLETSDADAASSLVPLPELRTGDRDEPIAIVGMGCRFPGAEGPDAFWELLINGVDAITEFPSDREELKADRLYDPAGGPGKVISKWGGFIDRVDYFDPVFFGISPREAERMDPQQRQLLEVSWEALEHAGIPLSRLQGTNTGVFVGISNHDYYLLQHGDLKQLTAHSGVGNAFSVAANRISYIFDFHGPSVAVDTACSSSLVAIHMACQALQAGEADVVLAGGVNVILAPDTTVAFSQAGMMSPTGRCKTFDASADGYVRSEGVGMVVLKRLSDAQRDGDAILAVIRGSAVNQDGRSQGISAPNPAAQAAVIRTAMQRAGIGPEDLDYIEAHGTGTRLGDPIEMEGLSMVLEGRSVDDPCFVGSVKTNVGHMESASGIAGLIKTVLALQHETIPPHIHLREINPLIPIDDLPIEIPTMAVPWPREPGRTRYAGVSSYGFGGANAHLILSEAPEQPPAHNDVDRTAHILTLSAQSPEALNQLIDRYETWLQAHPQADLGDVAHTANAGRYHFSQRLAVVAKDREELLARLSQAARGETGAGVRRGRAPSGEKPLTAWLFTGQGAQYPGMGRELYDTQPTFRAALDRCAAILDDYLERPLLDVLYPDSPEDRTIHDTAYTQPALFAIEYALTELWRSWGLEPDFVIGHSVGEYVAAVIAGVMSLEDGLKLIAARGRLMSSLPRDGSMAAVFSDIRTVAAAIAPYMQEVSIAGVNGPKLIVISGKTERVEAITGDLKAQGIRVQPLTVSHAFHSPLMDPILDEFEAVASEIPFRTPAIPIISNVTGMPIMPGEIIDASYWRKHIRMAVQFSAGMQALGRLGATVFLEVGPHPTLLGMGRRVLDDKDLVWAASLHRKQQDWPTMLDGLAQLYLAGLPIDWQGFDRDYERCRLHLPTYPFQRQRYWHSVNIEKLSSRELDHPILARRIRSPLLEDVSFEARAGLESHPWLGDHRIGDFALFPAAGFLELLASATRLAYGDAARGLKDVFFQDALVLGEEDTTLQVILPPGLDENAGIKAYALEDPDQNRWQVKATASVSSTSATPPPLSLDALREACSQPVDMTAFYDGLARAGLRYGPAFRGVQKAWAGEGQALGRLNLPEAAGDPRDFLIHPALLDAAFHVAAAALGEADEEEDRIYLPVGVASFRVLGQSDERLLWAHARLRKADGSLILADVQVITASGQALAVVEGLQIRPISASALMQELSRRDIGDWFYRLDWRPQPLETSRPVTSQPGWWLVFGDASGRLEGVIAGLKAGGDQIVRVDPGSEFGASTRAWTVNAFHKKDFERLLTALQPQHPLPPRGVVYAWGMDDDEDGAFAMAGALHLTQTLLLHGWSDKPRLWLVTRSAQAVAGEAVDARGGPLWGFGATLALEHPELHATLVDWPDEADVTEAFIAELLADDEENRIALRPDGRHVARLARLELNAGEAAGTRRTLRLEIPQRGQLSNLALVPMTRPTPGPGQVVIQVRAAGLNFRDVMNAMGLYPGDPGPLGGECAGVVVAVGEGVEQLQPGDRVMGIAPASFATYTLTDARLVTRIPDNLDFAEAATIPIVFLTAHYALNRLGGMSERDRVFIHSASGGVGLAAIQLAQRVGAEVFGAAGTDVKREYLRSLGVHHVYNSRSLDFADQVLADTDGAGVTMVLNSLAEGYIPANLKMLAQGGRFLEIGKVGIWTPERMAEARPDVHYHIIALDTLSAEQPELVGAMLAELAAMFAAGELKPLHRTDYPLEQAEAAFRFMAMAKHIGKIVLTLPEVEHTDAAAQRIPIREDAAYLITGGLGALGRLAATWLAEKGAGAVGLVSRRGPDEDARAWMEELETDGTHIIPLQADVAHRDELEHAIQELENASGLSLRGIIHAAGVLDDGVLLQQDWERFETVLAPKIAGATHLHHLTYNRDLDFFILYSSIASVLGSPGQSNYAAGNAYLDALAQARRAEGLPGLSINWGPWAEAGMAARSGQEAHSSRGLWAIPPELGLRALDQLMTTAAPPQAVVLSVDWRRFLAIFPQVPPLLTDFAPIRTAEPSHTASSELVEELASLPAEDRHDVVVTYLRAQVQRILGLGSLDQVDPYAALSDMGMDSLMAVELKNALDQATGRNLPATIAFEYPTIDAIAGYLLKDVFQFDGQEPEQKPPSPEPEPPTSLEPEPDFPDLDDLSDEELEALLMEKLEDMDEEE